MRTHTRSHTTHTRSHMHTVLNRRMVYYLQWPLSRCWKCSCLLYVLTITGCVQLVQTATQQVPVLCDNGFSRIIQVSARALLAESQKINRLCVNRSLLYSQEIMWKITITLPTYGWWLPNKNHFHLKYCDHEPLFTWTVRLNNTCPPCK